MKVETGSKARDSSGRISIGALSRACGIPAETLRTWERRYSFPTPVRKPSGHRLYQVSGIPRLRRIAQAVAQGHRAGDVIHATDQELEALLDSPSPPAHPKPARSEREPLSPEVELRDCLQAVESFDAPALTHCLLLGWARLSPVSFLEHIIGPLLRSVGEAWQAGRFEIRHEHFLSERVGDLLRSLRLPFEASARGPIIVLATPPGETHNLGLEMAALMLAKAGMRVVYLGTEVPLTEIAAVALDRRAAAVALSLSANCDRLRRDEDLGTLRAMLPASVTLVAGGQGAIGSANVQIIERFADLDMWVRGAAEW